MECLKSQHQEIKNSLKNVENHMKMLQENEQRVAKYFNHKDIKYAA